jgi:integrase
MPLDLRRFYPSCVQRMGTTTVKKHAMATPFADPRTGQLYFRRGVPEALRAAFDGRAQVKISLRTKDPAEAKIAFARENALFEQQLADARRQLAEGRLLATPGAVVRMWCERAPVANGLTGPQRLALTFMELDAAAGGFHSSAAKDAIFPPAILGPAQNTDWTAVLASRPAFDALLTEVYEDEVERTGTNWIRLRWHKSEASWRQCLNGPVQRVRAFEPSAARFTDDELATALLAIVDEKRSGDEDTNRARLAPRRARTQQPRLRPTMRLQQLFDAWKAGSAPRPQTAVEFQAAVDDFKDFAGDVAVSTIDADLLFDYRDEAAKLPATMPRADRKLPFRARVQKHALTTPKCLPATLKKRIGALQALLTYAFRQRWTSANAGSGIVIVGYSKSRRSRRSFEDHELGQFCTAPLFVDPQGWSATSRISDTTMFWISLLAITTGARLEEVGQVALADVKHDGDIVYLDIDEYSIDDDGAPKSVKTDDSIRLVPVHKKLIELGFLEYVDVLVARGHTQLFPDLKENAVGKRTKEASQKINRVIDRYVSKDARLVFHSTRHAFKAKGNDAGVNDRILDQICGHAPVSTGSRYGSEPRIRTIHRDLHRIDFSCIAWHRIAAGIQGIEWTAVLGAKRYDIDTTREHA